MYNLGILDALSPNILGKHIGIERLTYQKYAVLVDMA